MAHKLTRDAYVQLIEEDIAWIMKIPRTLEREHIILVLRDSIDRHYPPEPEDWCNQTMEPE